MYHIYSISGPSLLIESTDQLYGRVSKSIKVLFPYHCIGGYQVSCPAPAYMYTSVFISFITMSIRLSVVGYSFINQQYSKKCGKEILRHPIGSCA